MFMKIVSIQVVTGLSGPNKVTLHMDGITPPLPFYPEEKYLQVSATDGEAWAKENFPGVPIEIIRANGGNIA